MGAGVESGAGVGSGTGAGEGAGEGAGVSVFLSRSGLRRQAGTYMGDAPPNLTPLARD